MFENPQLLGFSNTRLLVVERAGTVCVFFEVKDSGEVVVFEVHRLWVSESFIVRE